MSRSRSQITQWWSGLLNGERWEAPDRSFIGHRDILVQSRARYEFVSPQVRGDLLDVGCGRGYGFDALPSIIKKRVGVDVSMAFLAEAHNLFPRAMLACGMGDALPFARQTFDTILAFEVIEHSQNDQMFLDELKRVARNGALIAISTPNRLVSSGHREKPLNCFHCREYTANEFHRLLKNSFSSVELYGQHERVGNQNARNKMVDRIPIEWKYRVPHVMQAVASVTLRPPLRIEDCQFDQSRLEHAATLVAICRQ